MQYFGNTGCKGYIWDSLFAGVINTEMRSFRLGFGQSLLVKRYVVKREEKPGIGKIEREDKCGEVVAP